MTDYHDFGLGDNRMTVSIVLTINNRSPEVSRQVAESLALPGNEADELIVVLDRATPEAREGAVNAYSDIWNRPYNQFIDIDGPPGWKCPAKAWNAGFKAATSDLLYCISSEVVQEEGNVKKAVELCTKWVGGAPDNKIVHYNTAVFGACHNSTPTQLVVGAEPGLLASSKMPRPLGFIVCMPRWAVDEIGGFDEEFMKGFWYDDDDLFIRLWHAGLSFLFDDSIHGTHLDHGRPGLETKEGQEGIERNAALMLKKHGTHHPWHELPKILYRREGQIKWEHP